MFWSQHVRVKQRLTPAIMSIDDSPSRSPSLPSPNDDELVARINQGDLDAFELLYRRYRDWVVNLAHRFTGSEDLALDVLQETFLYFLRKFPGFQLRAQLKTFLYPAVKNLSIAARRKAQLHQWSDEGEAFLAAAAESVQPGTAENDLAYLLAALSEEHREVLLLRFVDGLTLAEISQAMGIALGTAKSRLHNGLNLLRQDPRTRGFFER